MTCHTEEAVRAPFLPPSIERLSPRRLMHWPRAMKLRARVKTAEQEVETLQTTLVTVLKTVKLKYATALAMVQLYLVEFHAQPPFFFGGDKKIDRTYETPLEGVDENDDPRLLTQRNKLQKMETELWNLTIRRLNASAARNTENKRKWENNQRSNNVQQPNKRQEVVRAYTTGPNDRNGYAGKAPHYNKCKLTYNLTLTLTPATTQRAQVTTHKVPLTCFGCGVQGHYKSECPKLKNQNRGNQNGGGRARRRAADRSFVSTAFSSLIDITPTALVANYTIELANGKLIGADTIIRGCTLNLLNHAFNIDLMPIELGSFDVIIGMDWLSIYHDVIVCEEKLVRIPF
ncbi:reverse transcriptase domain-containing protein, partial [Tanacetum coccineum]